MGNVHAVVSYTSIGGGGGIGVEEWGSKWGGGGMWGWGGDGVIVWMGWG